MRFSKKSDTLIVIPVFNEEKNIKSVIDDLYANFKEADVLIVNDGSTDKTEEILESRRDVFVMHHIFNLGIGASFETGCQFALENGYSYIVRMDGDGQHNACFIQDLLTPVKKGKADISIGSRFLSKSGYKSSSSRLIGIKILSLFLSVMTERKITDPTSGFCAMNKNAFSFFSENCPEDYPEPEIVIYHKEFRIKEVPVVITKRYEGTSSITPLKSIYYMIKVLLSLFVHIFR